MKTLHTVSRVLVTFCMLLGVISYLPAQEGQRTQQTKPFQPEVGQPGKDVIWVPTPQELVDKMLDMAKVTPQDYVIDLGSGDGRTVIAAAKRGAHALGIEYNPDMVDLSRVNAANAGISDRATFMKADLFETDFSKATVITMFLLPEINMKLRPKLLEMRPGTRVVSNSFDMGDWEPDESATVKGSCQYYCTALLWIVPAKVEGRWRIGEGELALTQHFQKLSGTLTTNGKNMPISAGKMIGEQITFRAGGTVYSGRLSNNVIEGTVTTNSNRVSWSAMRAGN